MREPTYKPYPLAEPGSPTGAQIARSEDRRPGLNQVVNLLTVGALILGGAGVITELDRHGSGEQDKTVQVNPQPETRADAPAAGLRLTPEQLGRVNAAARGTALALMLEVKGSAPDGRNGYGQLMFTRDVPKNGYSDAFWLRAENTPEGTHLNVRHVIYTTPSGKFGDVTKDIQTRSFDFPHPLFTNNVKPH